MLLKSLIVIFIALFANTTLADTEYREHGTHQHGVAQLTIALSQQVIELELHSPAYNILGFEHKPHTEQQQQLVTQQFAILNQPSDLFAWDAICKLESAAINSPFEAHHGEIEHHDEHEEAETHSDIAVVYSYHCQSTPKSLNIKGLFTQFPNFETLNVQWVSDTLQSASVLNTEHTQVQFD